MPYLVTDHRTYKYFSDLRSAIDFISKANNKDLRVYADSGNGELEEISPADLLREVSFGSAIPQGNNSYVPPTSVERNTAWQAPQGPPQGTISSHKYNTIENPYEENDYRVQQAQKQYQGFSRSGERRNELEQRRKGFNPLSSLLITLIIFLIIVIAYFVILPIIIGNAIVGLGG